MNLKLFLLVIFVGVAVAKPFDWKSKISGFLSKIKAAGTHVLGIKKEYKEGRPWFCHNNECPEFTVKKKYEHFEERCYPKTTWLKAGGEGKQGESMSMRGMFRKLFNYIQGANEKQEKVKMTAPVITEAIVNANNSDLVDYQMHFFVPPTQAANLPQPNDADVEIVEQEARCVYVLSFGGWVMKMGGKTDRKIADLKSVLKEEGLEGSVKENITMFAGYDSPFRMRNRHNEVMLVKKE